MGDERILTNARIVLPTEIVDGTLVMRDEAIAEIGDSRAEKGENLDGDFVIPGLVELHTDHLESHYAPRPGVRWHSVSAIQAHDAQIAASGITTVFDCFRLGSDEEDSYGPGEMRALALAVNRAQHDARLRADHFVHLRCEVSAPNVMDEFNTFADHDDVRLASLMDHAPGQRQFQTMEKYRHFYKRARGMSEDAFDRFVARRLAQSERYADLHRTEISAECGRRGITLASHDDATLDHVADAVARGVRVAEFPTTVEAAGASHEAGLAVLMGAPNVVRGGSHSGNVSARDLAAAGLLDALSSDYVPISLVHASFLLADEIPTIALPDAIRMVTDRPAAAVGLDDRGRIEQGRRADLVRVRHEDGVPVIRSVWRAGTRVV